MFKGSIPALITPFRDGRIDEQDFQSFVDWQIKEGSHGVFPCGTTGESPTLTHQEHIRVIELCVEAAHGAHPSDCRHWLELDRRSHCTRPPCRESRSKRPSRGHPLLQ